jgi:hypothetical protein
MAELRNELKIVSGRPIPKDPLNFFQYKKGYRIMVTITDQSSVWKADLTIAESLFADMIICTPPSTTEDHGAVLNVVRDILHQRSRYPGVKEDPELEKISKTWILPHKVNLYSDLPAFLDDSISSLQQKFEILKDEPFIHFLKIEIAGGKEREILYKFMDQPVRPSLVLIKWSEDLDTHTATAYCAGHLQNLGYAMIGFENGYGLYMFRDQPLYDICSMKQPSLTNPIMDAILQSVNDKLSSTPTTIPIPETKSEA